MVGCLWPLLGNPIGDAASEQPAVGGGYAEGPPIVIDEAFSCLGYPGQELRQVVAANAVNFSVADFPLKNVGEEPRLGTVDVVGNPIAS